MAKEKGSSMLEPGWIPDWWRGEASSTSQERTPPSPQPRERTSLVSVEKADKTMSPSVMHESSTPFANVGDIQSTRQGSERSVSRAQDDESLRAPSRNPGLASTTNRIELLSLGNDGDGNGVEETVDDEAPADRLMIERDRDRAVNRRLKGIHIFMIAINGVLGVGLYVRGGMILRLGGPAAVLLSFSLVGCLAWGVMQCIAEMLCIWPISGSLSTYVSEFVDVELGIAVGVAYWFTYAISFAALIAATAGEAEYWDTPKGIQGGILFFLIPLFILILNAFGIETYGLFEVVSGFLKLAFLLVIIVFNIVINQRGFRPQPAGPAPKRDISLYPENVIVHDADASKSWTQAFFMSLSIAAFAYVGVEITAASALEARVPPERTPKNPSAIGKTVKSSVVFIPFVAALLYVIAGVLVTLNIKWDNPDLPRVSWRAPGPTFSAFVLIARDSGIDGLAGTLNVFLMFTALTCANTNLYVASRTLFSLTRTLDGGSGQPWYTRFLATLGKTNNRKVPMRALIASCIFAWIPFLYLSNENESGPSKDIGTLLDVLSEMGTVGVIVVWACECWAYIRFYHCIRSNKIALREVPLVRRWNRGTNNLPDDFPYRGHGQPFTAYISLSACLFLLVVANGSSLWNGFHVQPFLSAYLAPICFLTLWGTLKILRNGQWHLVDLSNGRDVAEKMLRLHEIRFRSAEDMGSRGRNVRNLWGLI
ncbi:unnamed protein product [Periconia digitata]|uniref:Amino acid permease/ SLC12A domain-containing protein n=1 Tax=Periconia digitata TaxID=1303443 RepID=A0A9W4UDU7_9PLEO|nr:unnamed protein product [Periconia digitata]